jgi:lysylphosphatidylglycerol synthetase-like protein (DUF2156 family)
MKATTNHNYIKSSNLIFLSAILGAINLLLLPGLFSSKTAIIVGFFTLIFLIFLGIMIRLGISWIKYLLLILVLLGLTSFPLIIRNFLTRPLNGTFNIVQSIIQFYAVVILFQKK